MKTFGYRPEKTIVDHVVAAGVPAADAESIIAKVMEGALAALEIGKTVTIPGVGRLVAPEKQGDVPSQPHLRHNFRKVFLRDARIVARSEPWEPIDYSKRYPR